MHREVYFVRGELDSVHVPAYRLVEHCLESNVELIRGLFPQMVFGHEGLLL